MNLTDIQILIGFNRWANERLAEALAPMTHDQFLRDLASSHGSVRGTLAHLAGAEGVWLKRLRGEAVTGLPKPDEFPDMKSLKTYWDRIENDLANLVAAFRTDDDIRQPITYSDLKGNVYAQPRWQILQHMVNHSTYHRGQITVLLRQLGLTPMGTDMIMYFRTMKQAD